MHFRPFSVKKNIRFFFIFSDFAAFSDFFHKFFFYDLLNIRLVLPLLKTPNSPRPLSPIVVFYKKIRKKSEKNRISDADPQKRISDS